LIARHLKKKVEDRITVDQALDGITALFPELGTSTRFNAPPRNSASASSSSSSAPPVNNIVASSSSSSGAASNVSNNRRAHSSSGASSGRSSRRRLNGPSGSAGASTINSSGGEPVSRWVCPDCHEPNRAERLQCNNCGKARDGLHMQEENPGPQVSIARKEQEANDEAIAKWIAEQEQKQQQERARRQAARKYKMHKSEGSENQKA